MFTVFVAVTPGTGLPLLCSSWVVMISVVVPLKFGAGLNDRLFRAKLTGFVVPRKVIVAELLAPAVNVSPLVLVKLSVPVPAGTETVTSIGSDEFGSLTD